THVPASVTACPDPVVAHVPPAGGLYGVVEGRVSLHRDRSVCNGTEEGGARRGHVARPVRSDPANVLFLEVSEERRRWPPAVEHDRDAAFARQFGKSLHDPPVAWPVLDDLHVAAGVA